MAAAQKLYYVASALMLVIAYWCNTLPCTTTYATMILAYNEGRLAEHSLSKNILAAGRLMCYCWGVTVIFDGGKDLHGLKLIAVLMLGAIFATTGHASDYRDRAAVALMSRKTVPLLLPPRLARWSLAALVAVCIAGLMCLWQPLLIASIAFSALSLWTSLGFVVSHEEKDDH